MSFCLYTNCYSVFVTLSLNWQPSARAMYPLLYLLSAWHALRLWMVSRNQTLQNLVWILSQNREPKAMKKRKNRDDSALFQVFCDKSTFLMRSKHWDDRVKTLRWLGQNTEMTASERHYPWDRKRRITVCCCLSVLYKKCVKIASLRATDHLLAKIAVSWPFFCQFSQQ